MENAAEELVQLLREMTLLNADLQAQLNAQRIVIKALIVSHAKPKALHGALLDQMDAGADSLRPQRVAHTAEFVDEYMQALMPLLAPPREEP